MLKYLKIQKGQLLIFTLVALLALSAIGLFFLHKSNPDLKASTGEKHFNDGKFNREDFIKNSCIPFIENSIPEKEKLLICERLADNHETN